MRAGDDRRNSVRMIHPERKKAMNAVTMKERST